MPRLIVAIFCSLTWISVLCDLSQNVTTGFILVERTRIQLHGDIWEPGLQKEYYHLRKLSESEEYAIGQYQYPLPDADLHDAEKYKKHFGRIFMAIDFLFHPAEPYPQPWIFLRDVFDAYKAFLHHVPYDVYLGQWKLSKKVRTMYGMIDKISWYRVHSSPFHQFTMENLSVLRFLRKIINKWNQFLGSIGLKQSKIGANQKIIDELHSIILSETQFVQSAKNPTDERQILAYLDIIRMVLYHYKRVIGTGTSENCLLSTNSKSGFNNNIFSISP